MKRLLLAGVFILSACAHNAPKQYAAPVAATPSVTLPTNYRLAWNQDFTTAAYSPFNQQSIVSLVGPPGSVWRTANGLGYGAATNYKFDGTEGDPFSTSKGYLNIHANGNGSPPYGGQIMSATYPNEIGFVAANAYWEAKILLPSGGSEQWPVWWLAGDVPDPTTGQRPEIDITEFGYQIPGTTNGVSSIHLHVWPGGASAGDFQISSLPVTSDGFHVFGCLVQPGSVSIYLDGSLLHTFSVASTFSAPMSARLDFGFGPGTPTSGCTSGDLGCKYIRCWTPQ